MSDPARTIHSFRQPDGTKYILPLTISWAPFQSHAFISMRNSIDGALLQITPFPKQMAEVIRNKIREEVQTAADQALFRSVEPSIEIKTFEMGEVKGYYYFAQDRKPKPGEWPFVTSGFFCIQDRIVNVTILTYFAPPEGAKEALSAIAELQIVTAFG
jgi:hypothetical protein